jgi:hypothetical protein
MKTPQLSWIHGRSVRGIRIIRHVMGYASMALSVTSTLCAVDATITPSTTTSVSAAPVVLDITGLTNGESVTIERFVDANSDGTLNADEFLAERFTVTDGQVTSIGGIRNTNIPGDEDLAANGQISINLTAPSTGSDLGRVAGAHAVRISSPVSAFTTLTKTLTVDQPIHSQSISGTVTDGTNPVPFAAVYLLTTVDEEVALGVISNASGQFSINAPVGNYQVVAIKAGNVGNFGSSPIVDLTAGLAAIDQDVTMIPATTTISGSISDASTSAGIGGIQMYIEDAGGNFTILSTNPDGTYTANVTAGIWAFEVTSVAPGLLGYLRPDAFPAATANTNSGAATGINIQLAPSTALIYGTVTDPGSTPLSGIVMGANNSNNTFRSDATTNAAGQYVLPVNADTWSAYINNESPGISGFILPDGINTDISAGQAIQADFMLSAVNAHIQGTVTNLGAPVSGIRIGAWNQNSSQYVSTITGIDGSYDLGVVAGTWNVQLESESAASFNVVGSSVEVTLAVNDTVSGIDFAVLSSTATISGTLKDSALQAVSGNVTATATIATVDYFANTSSDAGGNYSLPVVDGSWTVCANANGFNNPANIVRAVSGASETVNFTFLTSIETWRQTNFGNTANSGDGADLFDYDYDGIPNIVEYALGLNPKIGSSTELPMATRTGNNLVISLTEPGGISGITYGSEWSTNLQNGSWTSVSDSGLPPAHTFSVPFGTNPKLFMRLKVTRP